VELPKNADFSLIETHPSPFSTNPQTLSFPEALKKIEGFSIASS